MKRGNITYKLILGGIFAATVAAIAFILWPAAPEAPQERQGKTRTSREMAKKQRKQAATAKQQRQAGRPMPKKRAHLKDLHSVSADLTPAEAALQEKIEGVLETEKFEDALALIPQAMAATNKEIRLSMISTLAWFDEKALPELTPFLVDSDEDVRNEAMSAWEGAMASVEDNGQKAQIVENVMTVLTDADHLETVANELVGTDDKLAIETLLRVMDGPNAAAAKAAREAYEMVTGEAYTTLDDAEKWLAENYLTDEG